jgi:hypothetical protein
MHLVHEKCRRESYSELGKHNFVSVQVLFAATMVLALIMIILKGFDGPWYYYMYVFNILLHRFANL